MLGDKGEQESQILINTQRAKRSNGNGVRAEGHVAPEEIALIKQNRTNFKEVSSTH